MPATMSNDVGTYVRTVRVPVQPLTARKRGLLNRQMKHYLKVRQAAAEYFRQDGNSATDLTYSERNELRKSIQSRPTVNINAQSATAAIVEVAQNYEEYEKDPTADAPWPEGADVVAYSAQRAYLFHDGGWYLSLPARNGDLILPLLVSDDEYHQRVLPDTDAVPPRGRRPGVAFEDIPERAYSGRTQKLGECQVIATDAGFEVHFSVTFERRVGRDSDDPRYVVGVDRGRNELVYAALYDRERDRVDAWTNINGSEIEHIMDELAERISEVQEAGALDDMLRLRKRRHRFKKQKDYEAANSVIRLARQAGGETLDSFGVVIVLEDLEGMSGLGNYSAESRRFNEWTYYRQSEAITDKAEPFDIDIETIDPAHTSQVCSRCGSGDTRRSGVHFECHKCGYEQHADANAAVNIAKRYSI